MVKIGREKTQPNTLVSAASVRGRTLADKVYYMVNVSGSENEMVTSRDFYDCRVANNAKPVPTLGRATA